MDEEIDPQEIIPDHQESPVGAAAGGAGDPLGSGSSIGGVDHPSMSDYLEFMKEMPRRSVDSSGADRIDTSATADLDSSVGSYSQGFPATIYRPGMSHADATHPNLNVPRYSTRAAAAAFQQFESWSSPFNQDGGMALNSSGEENKISSPEEYARLQEGGTPAGTFYTTDSGQTAFRPNVAHQLGGIIGPLDSIGCMPVCPGRETHNEKERKRRYRIKNACSLLKDLVPGLSDKTDKATVLEYTVQYLIHLKKHVGRQFDKDFMEKYSPY